MDTKQPIFEGEQKILDALEDTKILSFVNRAFVTHYQNHFTDKKDEVTEMLNESFRLLHKSVEKGWNYKLLEKAVLHIDSKIFKKNDPSFWFNSMYKDYKKNLRPKVEYGEIKKFLRGKRILDYGSGTGSLALELDKKGYSVYTTDVLDYRFMETEHIPFMKLATPFDTIEVVDQVDTILVKAVLHHISPTYLIPILTNLSSISKRIIIEESVYGIPKKSLNVQKKIAEQPLFAEFISFKKDEQYRILTLCCFFSNALAFGKPEMNLPFEFKTVQEWERLFDRLNFKLRKVDILGFELERVTPDSRVQFVCDC